MLTFDNGEPAPSPILRLCPFCLPLEVHSPLRCISHSHHLRLAGMLTYRLLTLPHRFIRLKYRSPKVFCQYYFSSLLRNVCKRRINLIKWISFSIRKACECIFFDHRQSIFLPGICKCLYHKGHVSCKIPHCLQAFKIFFHIFSRKAMNLIPVCA